MHVNVVCEGMILLNHLRDKQLIGPEHHSCKKTTPVFFPPFTFYIHYYHFTKHTTVFSYLHTGDSHSWRYCVFGLSVPFS